MADAIDWSEEAVLAEARAASGLADFGDESFRPGLRALLAHLRGEPVLEKGRKRNRRRVVTLLATRAKVEDALRRNPEVLARPVASPVVLTGLPRSATSALFNLLGEDPAARPLRLWETQCPEPLEGAGARRARPAPRGDRRLLRAGPREESRLDEDPLHQRRHARGVRAAARVRAATACSSASSRCSSRTRAGTRAQVADLRPLYAYQKRLMQLLDWQRPGERWLLKAPAHLWGLDALAATFPDVAIVWTHRDPVACTASACSMTAALMSTLESLDKRWLGPAVMEFYARSLDRGLAARDAMDARRVVDVSHDEFVSDAVGVAKRIYAHFGLALGPAALAAFEAHAAANPRAKHGRHDYDLEEFGLSEARVRERFRAYQERFPGLAE